MFEWNFQKSSRFNLKLMNKRFALRLNFSLRHLCPSLLIIMLHEEVVLIHRAAILITAQLNLFMQKCSISRHGSALQTLSSPCFCFDFTEENKNVNENKNPLHFKSINFNKLIRFNLGKNLKKLATFQIEVQDCGALYLA